MLLAGAGGVTGLCRSWDSFDLCHAAVSVFDPDQRGLQAYLYGFHSAIFPTSRKEDEMVAKEKRSEVEAEKFEKAIKHTDDPILRKLRYPDKGVHRVKYDDDELLITSEDGRD
jgi:hypothetical protein